MPELGIECSESSYIDFSDKASLFFASVVRKKVLPWVPEDLREYEGRPEQVQKAFQAFRRALKDKKP